MKLSHLTIAALIFGTLFVWLAVTLHLEHAERERQWNNQIHEYIDEITEECANAWPLSYEQRRGCVRKAKVYV